jgi:adenine phosphoribosyltransferase
MYKDYIIEVPNFPIKGVNFKDISPLLSDHRTFRSAVADMGRLVKNPDYWVGIDARGFIFASALSMVYGGGVVMCRKKGKLPPPVQSYGYTKEYGVDRLEIKEGSGNVVIVDDVLASGGTLQVVNNLVENAGYTVKDNLVLIDLKYVPTIVDFTLDVHFEKKLKVN